jgi:tetratricopeptide (TPR) repeat protein/DNA-binding SARP family transcriptional activator
VKLVETAFGILGRTALLIDGTVQEAWGRPKERGVLSILLLYTGRWVSVETLIEWGWPEETSQPRNLAPTIHTYTGRIRKWLRQMPSQPVLESGNGSYRLAVDKSQIDYFQFLTLIGEARAHAKRQDFRQTADFARRALDLWRGRPLDDLWGEPARAWRQRVVQDDWLGANRTLLAALLELSEFDEVLTRVGDLQTDHANDVTLAAHRMSALHGLGRYEDETAYYISVRQTFKQQGDDAAMEHLRRHHEELRSRVDGPGSTQNTEPTVTPRQLLHDVADFVGRQDLVTALDAAVANSVGRPASGVVVVDGMPGVGKTALVKHWGHRVRQYFPDGDLYVDLNGFSEDSMLPRSTVVDDFLGALGCAPDMELNSRARELLLTRVLSGRRTLVVLDNARDAKHVEKLVALLPDALVIVTSRQQLGSLSARTGARRVQVVPMTPAEATSLLSRRIGTRRHVPHKDLVRLAALCGGLPLIITLMAEHVAAWPAGHVAAHAERLDWRQVIFEVGEDAGSINVRTFFSWSYESLGPAEQRLFRLLGLHPGTEFSIDAACALDGRPRAESVRSIRTLVSAHLLQRANALDRYRFHDLIREFARHCADSDEPTAERQAAVLRVASFYLASAVRANRTLYPSRVNASELAVEGTVEPVEITDAEQAKAWFATERTALVAMINSAAAAGHHDHAWRLADAAVIFFDRNGFYEDSLSVQRIAAASARTVGDEVGEASALVGLGRVCLAIGDHAEARRHLDRALRLVEDLGHEVGQVAALSLLGKLETQRGDLPAALEIYRRGMRIAQRTDDRQGMCWTSYRIGQVLRATEQHDRALVYLARSQILAERDGDQSAHASTMIEIGLVQHDKGEHSIAAAHCEQALTIAEAIPDLAVTADACLALAEINTALGKAPAAIGFALRAIGMSKHNTAAHAFDVLGDCHHASGDATAAATAWQEAAERFEQLGNPTRAALMRAKSAHIPHPGVQVPSARPVTPPTIIHYARRPDER